MSYLISEDIKVLESDVKKFCDREVLPVVKECDFNGEVPEKLYERAAELGYNALEIPEEYGGAGLKKTEAAALLAQMAYADAGFAVTMAVNGLAVKPVVLSGSAEQKKHVCDKIISGGYGAFCMTESDAGSDAGSMQTKAEKVKDGYIVDGVKSFVTNGTLASFYTTAAVTENGISLFIIDRESEGVEPGKQEDKMGIRLSDTCEVAFSQVFVPDENLIGEEGRGFETALKALDEGRAMIAAAATGLAQRCIDESEAYSKKRVQFGKPVFENQAVQFKLADMEIKTEAARQLISYALTIAETGKDCRKEAAMAKCMASDAAVYAALETIQIMGGYGYSREFPAEKLLRDAKIFQIFEGTNEIQKMVIAKNL